MFARKCRWSLVLLVSITVAVYSSAYSTTAMAQEDSDKPAKQLPESKLLKLLIGIDKGRIEAWNDLETRGDDALTAKLLIKVLDKEVVRKTTQPRETSITMIMQLGKIDLPETTEALLRYLVVENYRFGLTAADSLGQREDPKLITNFKKAWQDKNFAANFNNIFGFRKSVVAAMLKIEDPQVVDFCIKLLPSVDGIVRYDILRFLTVMTDQDFGNNEENWKIWWKDNEKDFQFTQKLDESALSASRNLDIKGLEVPTYYGMKIYAKRIIFVLDISSSMWEDGPDSPNTRFEAAQRELIATLLKLPDDVSFSILTFNAGLKPYLRGKPIQATQANREKAAKWVSYINWGKGTNSYGALMRSFKMDTNVETIMFLSDGKPSKGAITDPPLILQAVRKENKFRKVVIFSIGIFTGGVAKGSLADFMDNLARQNFGVYKQIN